jgi:peptidoglycan/LPS O-acetylase OafA/YrhL
VGLHHLRRRDRWLLLAPVVTVVATALLFYGAHRIRSPLEPALVILAAVSLVGWTHHLGRGRLLATVRSEGTTDAATTPRDRGGIAHQPALDGIRGLAVALVLCFHGGFSWMAGGYVGVSVFFTLSGFLITTLLLVEHDRHGRIRLAAFWARRLQRLAPASLLLLLCIAVAGSLGAWGWLPTLRRDLVSAALQVANWAKLAGSQSYAEMINATLGRVGPLEHFWSLSIEEQFYWVWPFVILVVVRRASLRRRALTLAGIAVAAGVAAPVIAWSWGPNAAYFSTPARMGEILIGAALAALLLWRPTVPVGAGAVGLAGLVVIGLAAAMWDADSGPAYDGALPLFALASAALIWGVQEPGMLRRALAVRPLRALGTVSYGVYLYHWPIFAVLDENRVGLEGASLFAVRLGVTFLLAAASYRFVERPIRSADLAPMRVFICSAVATGIVVLIALIGVPAHSGARPVDVQEPGSITPVMGTLAPFVVAPVEAPAPGDSVPDPNRPLRVLVIGDSTAEATGAGLRAWAADHPTMLQVQLAALPGCGLIRSGVIPTDGEIDFDGQCDMLLDVVLPDALQRAQPDVALLMVSMRDVEDRIWDDAEGLLAPFDPRFRERLSADYAAMADRLSAAGVSRIAWVLAPIPAAPFVGEQRKMLDPARYEVQYDVIRELAADRPGVVRVLDLDGWLRAAGKSADARVRPDGIHWELSAAYSLSADYIVPELLSAMSD